MALQWRWKEKCGEITMVQTYPDEEDQKYTISLYKGNAYLIMLHEYERTPGTEAYEVFGFFNDKQHMRACLGLEKKRGYTSNIYETPYQRFTKLRINKARYRHTDYKTERKERRKMSEDTLINMNTLGVFVDGHEGMWRPLYGQEINGDMFYLMESEEYGNEVANILLNMDGDLLRKTCGMALIMARWKRSRNTSIKIRFRIHRQNSRFKNGTLFILRLIRRERPFSSSWIT